MTAQATLTNGEINIRLEAIKERMDAERREQFVPFGVPMDCYWPASRVYHQQSALGPQTKFRMTSEDVDVFTRKLDYKRYPRAARTSLPHPKALDASLEDVIRRRHSERAFSQRAVSLDALAKLLELSCGVTQDQDIPRRAAPSPGGLYAVEVYPLAFAVEGL